MSKLKYFVPNAITLSSLFCGFSAIIFAFNNELRFAFMLILIGSVLDFLDGLTAKLLDAKSELGAQLDSLSDLVTFGVAPGVMIYVLMDVITDRELFLDIDNSNRYFDYGKFMVMSDFWEFNEYTSGKYASPEVNQLWVYRGWDSQISWKVLAVAGLIPIAGALRLAKFNVKQNQVASFEGLAIPAAGLFVASIPIVIEQFFIEGYQVDDLLDKHLIAVPIFLIAILMVLPIQMFSFKLKSLKWKDAKVQYIFIVWAIPLFVTCLLIKNIWLSIPLIVFLYLIVSVINNLIRRNEV